MYKLPHPNRLGNVPGARHYSTICELSSLLLFLRWTVLSTSRQSRGRLRRRSFVRTSLSVFVSRAERCEGGGYELRQCVLDVHLVDLRHMPTTAGEDDVDVVVVVEANNIMEQLEHGDDVRSEPLGDQAHPILLLHIETHTRLFAIRLVADVVLERTEKADFAPRTGGVSTASAGARTRAGLPAGR